MPVSKKKLLKAYFILSNIGMKVPGKLETEPVIKAIQSEFHLPIVQVPDNEQEQYIDDFLEIYAEGSLDSYIEERKTRVAFYTSPEWLALKKKVIKIYGHICLACGCEDKEIHCDHIFSKVSRPDLALDIRNLQTICRDCNLLKSGKSIDYRDKEELMLLQAYFIDEMIANRPYKYEE